MKNNGRACHNRNAYGYAFDLDEIAKKWENNTTLGYVGIRLAGIGKPGDYVRNLFQNMFYNIVKEVIITGNMFTGRFGSYKITIYMKRFEGEEFNKMVRDGYLEGVDFAQCAMVAYYPFFHVESGTRTFEKIITLDDETDKLLVDLLNEGMVYEHQISAGL